MNIKLTFLGGAQNVTGSQYLVEANNTRFLVDCGLYQERQYLSRNWALFPVPVKSLNAILLTHAHLDHCGLVPKLVKDGFRNPIYCTPPTAEIAEIMLMDAAKLQLEDAEYKRRRHEREGRRGPYPELPLYTPEDASTAFSLLSPVEYKSSFTVGEGITATFYDAGHVLGSAMIEVKIQQGGDERIIIFPGDIGRWDKPMLHDPTVFEYADYVLVESTYGDRILDNPDESASGLADVISETMSKRGNIIIPSFALERTQEVLYYLNKLLVEDRIPHIMVFVDSPMAVRITDVFKDHPEVFDKEMMKLIRQDKSPIHFQGLHLVRTIEESKSINHITGSIAVIAGSGMCTGGRIKHHLVANISRPESTILFVGYQAEGTLGRQIVEGKPEVRILGQYYDVKANIVQLIGFSAHADQNELLRWLSGFKKAPKRLIVTHGEKEVTQRFADMVQTKTGWNISIPKYRDELLLE